MLTLTFQLGADRWGLPHGDIAEVIALVDLTPVAGAPPEVAGAFSYHGRWVPVIDLSQVHLGRSSSRRWSTRIIVTRPPISVLSGNLLGLIAESATEMIGRTDAETTESVPFHPLDLAELLPAPLVAWLAAFKEPPPAPLAKPVQAPRHTRRRPRHYQYHE